MSRFYLRYSKYLLIAGLLALPFLILEGERVPANNDIETWLPQESQVRVDYEWFKDQFGAEELILIGVPRTVADDELVEALAGRVERLESVRQVWTPQRFGDVMGELGVPGDVINTRLTGLAISPDRQMVGLVALLTEEGVADRSQTVADVRETLAYCQLPEKDVLLTGAPVVVAELNRLGSVEQNRAFFMATLFISFILLYLSTRNWQLSSAILLITVFAIELTQTSVKWCGGEMNFILAALPVMVMVFTLAIAVHVVHYYQSLLGEPNPLQSAISMAWKPVALATLTTTIGLASLGVSDIGPVRQFGFAGAAGAIAAMISGLGFTPALLSLWPNCVKPITDKRDDWGTHWAHALTRRSGIVSAVGLIVVVICGVGLTWLTPRVDPLDFLPRDSKVVADLLQCERELTNVESIEIVVDFGTEDVSFVHRLNRVREIESRVAAHSAVRHTMSLASFFPPEMPTRALEAARLFGRARSDDQHGEYLSAGDRYWRISARVAGDSPAAKKQAFNELSELLKDEPVKLTGVAPLLAQAQQQIFEGFWESFATAFFIIACIMALYVRSLKIATLAMLPNLAPIVVVFGMLGWTGRSIDIGMMMTASIALGIAVDGTFHFLVIFQQERKKGRDAERASFEALTHTAAPIFRAALIASCGMLALTGSSFSPTVRFGWLMAVLLMTAVVGDLVFLPAMLAISAPRTQGNETQNPKEKRSSAEAPVQSTRAA
ncbi:MAG: MMPL family transporter [Planctomycetaceae bacterium]|nr:MMPL family transporter [Planctomycetaceae bacterium]MCB9954214.1 MMPL family transporter [Planctomycetaceae bacterium]